MSFLYPKTKQVQQRSSYWTTSDSLACFNIEGGSTGSISPYASTVQRLCPCVAVFWVWHTELFSGPDWATFSQLNSWRDKKGTLWPIQKSLLASLAGPCVGYLQDPFGVEAYKAIWGRLVGGHLPYWLYLSFAIFLIPIVFFLYLSITGLSDCPLLVNLKIGSVHYWQFPCLFTKIFGSYINLYFDF